MPRSRKPPARAHRKRAAADFVSLDPADQEPTSLDPAEFYPPVTQPGDVTTPISVRIPATRLRSMDKILLSRRLPFETRSDLILWALEEGLDRCAAALEDRELLDTFGKRRALDATVRSLREAAAFEDLVANIEQSITPHLQRGDWVEGERVLRLVIAEVGALSDERDRTRLLAALRAKYPDLVYRVIGP